MRFRHLVPGEVKVRAVLRGALLGVHLPGIARGRRFTRPVLIPTAGSQSALCSVWGHLAPLSGRHPAWWSHGCSASSARLETHGCQAAKQRRNGQGRGQLGLVSRRPGA